MQRLIQWLRRIRRQSPRPQRGIKEKMQLSDQMMAVLKQEGTDEPQIVT